jgi:hypothetical protein
LKRSRKSCTDRVLDDVSGVFKDRACRATYPTSSLRDARGCVTVRASARVTSPSVADAKNHVGVQPSMAIARMPFSRLLGRSLDYYPKLQFQICSCRPTVLCTLAFATGFETGRTEVGNGYEWPFRRKESLERVEATIDFLFAYLARHSAVASLFRAS